ncbi:MAG: NADH-quinone oxidoreductase subunit A [Chloroflexi bacterium]|nr:NADH-quinone oxidoreductase subunit A [Chloroflexota bacterium]
MLAEYGYIGLFLVVALLFAAVALFLPVILRFIRIVPHKPNPIKNSTFECGMETIGKTWVQFNFRYYFYALIFVALDILVVFLYPWAVGLKQLGGAGLVVILIFIAIVIIGYVYAWREKVLEWK